MALRTGTCEGSSVKVRTNWQEPTFQNLVPGNTHSQGDSSVSFPSVCENISGCNGTPYPPTDCSLGMGTINPTSPAALLSSSTLPVVTRRKKRDPEIHKNSTQLYMPWDPSIHRYGLPDTNTLTTQIRIKEGPSESDQFQKNIAQEEIPGSVAVSMKSGNDPTPSSSQVSVPKFATNNICIPIPSTPSLSIISTPHGQEVERNGIEPPPPPPIRNREQRKRERRERRHLERHSTNGIPVAPSSTVAQSTNDISDTQTTTHAERRVPGLLNLPPPPPYSTLPLSPTVVDIVGRNEEVPGRIPTGMRHQFAPLAIPPITRTHRRSFGVRGITYSCQEEPKSCCGMSTSQTVSIRWFIILIAVIGICCTVAGTALGAARSSGSQHLTLSLLMIGIGVVLLTVSAVAWRLTANESGSSSCRAMLGFGSGRSRGDGGSEPNRVFVPRLPPSYGRPHHPYAAMMYPDYQYRPPPPSYQASMQEYRLRLLLLERSNPSISYLAGNGNSTPIRHPPPAYRPYNRTQRYSPSVNSDTNGPPSYRNSSFSLMHTTNSPNECQLRESSISYNQHGGMLSYFSQESLSLAEEASNILNSDEHSPVVTVMQVSVDMNRRWEEDHGVNPDPEKNFTSTFLNKEEKGGRKDGNLVRIVQTTDSSQVIGRESVIVTVSGSAERGNLWEESPIHQHRIIPNNEVQILAHL